MDSRPDPAEPASPLRHLTVILNPTSGRGKGARRRSELERLIADAVARFVPDKGQAKPCWEIRETTAPGDGAALAAEAVARGADVVAAAGGDGTCRDVVNGLVGMGARLGVLPLGTGNDFARTLGIGADLERAVETLFSGVPMPVDLGRAQDRYFLVAGGCGFDAAVTARVNRGFRYLRGTAAYVGAVCDCLRTFRPAQMRLTLDGQAREVCAMLCTVANAPMYGGGMKIAPDARLDDGLFDICLIGSVGRIEFLRTFPRVFRGTHVTHPKVTMLRARQVRIETETPLPVFADGDVIGTAPVEFTLEPHAVSVLALRR